MESRDRPRVRSVNNAIYTALNERWYDARDDPVALLRAEARQRNPWIAARIAEQLGPGARTVLDVGCGAGFLANDLARYGHRVVGLDASPESLAVAAAHDPTGGVHYELGDARALPHDDASFDVVCAMDFLEHVEEPARVIAEAARVLVPGGLLFFHTFDRNVWSWLVVIKGVEWFVRNTPHDLHVLRLFIRPSELARMCRAHGLVPVELHGSRPKLRVPLIRMLLTGVVGDDVEFEFTRSLRLGYIGFARKRPAGAMLA